jgi:RHS repeat-associated protein
LNDAGQVVSTTTPEPGNGQPAQTTSTVFDTQGRALRITQPDSATVTNEYTPAGLLKKTYGSRAYPVEYTFDAQSRMKTMNTWQDFSGNAGTATTTWYYDTQRGWLTNKTYQGGLGTTYTNTPAGRLKWRQWARGETTTYDYNAEGELTKVYYSDTTPGVTNVYDAMGRLVAVTNGSLVCLRSNNLAGALLSERWQGGPLDGWWVTNHFDSLQRRDILQVFSGSTNRIQQNYAYDAASRMTQVWQGSYGASYAYLANSPLVAQIGFTNNGTGILTTVKQYDHLNRLSAISSGTGVAPVSSHAYLYNAANQRVQANREDGAYWRYEYDKLGQVVSGKKYWQDGTPIPGMQFEYGFDDIGNRQSTKAGGNASGVALRPATYRPNLLNQYTNRTVPGGLDVLGAASATNSVTVNGSPADYRHGEFFQELITTNNTNAAMWQTVRVTNTASGAYETGAVFLAQSPESFTHDADGNLTQDGRWDYTWDGENRLIAMETRAAAYNAGAPRQKLLFGYDWQGRRISKTVSNYVSGAWSRTADLRFVYDGWNLLAILNSPSAITQQFMWGLDLSGSLQGAGGVGGLVKVYDNTANKHYFPAYDGNGNVMTLLDSGTGAEAARYEYGPFGEPLVVAGSYAQSNLFRFSTKFTDDETGLLYYGYRNYNPSTGRWLSRDPIAERGGLNLYGFVHNNPQSYADRDGRFFNPGLGLISIGMGWGIAVLTGEDYSPGEALVDFTMGSLGPGLLKRGYDLYKTCGKVRVQAKLTATAVKRLRSVVDPADVANTKDFVDKAIRAEWSLRVSTKNKAWDMAGIAVWHGVKEIAKSEIKNHTDTVDQLNVTIDQTIHPDGRTDTKIDIQTNHQDVPPYFPWPPTETPGPFPPIELPRD